MLKQFCALLFLFLFVSPLALAEGYQVESIGALTETKVAEAMRGALEEKGLRVTDGQGKVVCEIWLRKEVPTAGEEVAGALFAQIGEGTFTGVIHFPNNGGDYRGQGLKAGWYTMRYGLILQDGNHQGVSPTRDFFLICPAAEDTDPNKALSFDDLMKLSRTAAGTGHPSSWSLVQATDEKNLPRIVTNEHHHVIVETKMSIKGGSLAIGLIVVGKTEG